MYSFTYLQLISFFRVFLVNDVRKARKTHQENVFFRNFVNFWLDIYFIVFKQCVPNTLGHGETRSCGYFHRFNFYVDK